MVSPLYDLKKSNILIDLELNNKSSEFNFNFPTLYTLHESCGNKGKDAILDVSNEALNDVHPENDPIFLTDNTHVTKYKPFICKFSNLNPYAEIFVNKIGNTVPTNMKQVVSEFSETLYDNEFVTNDYSGTQLVTVHNKFESGVNFSMHSFQISCFLYFCYVLSVCVYA